MAESPGQEGEAETHGVVMQITEQRETRKMRTESDSSSDGAKGYEAKAGRIWRRTSPGSRGTAEKGRREGKAMGNPWGIPNGGAAGKSREPE
jgi:hypothetical protein